MVCLARVTVFADWISKAGIAGTRSSHASNARVAPGAAPQGLQNFSR